MSPRQCRRLARTALACAGPPGSRSPLRPPPSPRGQQSPARPPEPERGAAGGIPAISSAPRGMWPARCPTAARPRVGAAGAGQSPAASGSCPSLAVLLGIPGQQPPPPGQPNRPFQQPRACVFPPGAAPPPRARSRVSSPPSRPFCRRCGGTWQPDRSCESPASEFEAEVDSCSVTSGHVLRPNCPASVSPSMRW
uniref:basic proline-rich protein-like n=1 Tax=Ictidomys tridecemlineatus TaxID=43179 RepID=UPI001A9E1AF0|nr:basic proline-rich protein-like [Ictidomys tridecemlineatus]